MNTLHSTVVWVIEGQGLPVEGTKMLIEVILPLPGLAGRSRPELHRVGSDGHELETDRTHGDHDRTYAK